MLVASIERAICHKCFARCALKLVICGGQGGAWCGSLLGDFLGLLGFLRLLLASGGSDLDGLDLLNEEGTGDALTDLNVAEDTAVGAGYSAAGVGHALQNLGTLGLDTTETGDSGLLGDVLNGELATGGLDGTEFVRLGAV